MIKGNRNQRSKDRMLKAPRTRSNWIRMVRARDLKRSDVSSETRTSGRSRVRSSDLVRRQKSRCSFEAVAGRARERHEARMVVSGGIEHALTVLRTGRCGGGSLGSPVSAAAPSRRDDGVPQLDTSGERSPPRAPARYTRLQSIEGLRQNCIPRPPVRKSVSSAW